jgi:putative nucleotidyltransferase with HDIG domain
MPFSRAGESSAQIKLSQVISALSYALDITEGQPEGHAARSCMLGMRIAREIRLGSAESSALFYGLLLKDLGCSSNAGKMCYLFGSDDRTTKRDLRTANWSTLVGSLAAIARNAAQRQNWLRKFKHFARVSLKLKTEAKALVNLRCERGATIARELEFPALTAAAIRAIDEHWDGQGHPDGLAGEQIPLLARIIGISQTAEVFITQFGRDAACQMARDRGGSWFDPNLVNVFLSLEGDENFWRSFHSEKPESIAGQFEPEDKTLIADDARLDRVAHGFSQVIDAKSPWTFRHSEGVARISAGIAEIMGYSWQDVRYLRRAALVHDVGKLGISNMILDKPGKLTPDEFAEMKRHTLYTQQILARVDGFKDLADLAASHHERLDGKGYHRGLTASELGTSSRILLVADMYEALSAKRPYRQDLSNEEVMTILSRDVGTGICPAVFEALKTYIVKGGYVPAPLAA